MSILLVLALSLGSDVGRDRAALLEGVSTLEARGVPGRMAVWGDDAFVVLATPRRLAVVAAARYGHGRVVAFAHNAYVSGADPGPIFDHALRWAGRLGKHGRIAIVGRDDALAGALAERGHEVENDADPARLRCDVAVWPRRHELEPEEEQGLSRFVQRGGGLVVGVCPWGFEQVTGKSLAEALSPNHVMAPMGLGFVGGYAQQSDGGGFRVADSHPNDAHAGRILKQVAQGRPVGPALASLEVQMRGVPPDARAFWRLAERTIEGFDESRAPRPEQPLDASDELGRLWLSWWTERWRSLDPGAVRAAPGADAFPGAVRPGARSEEVDLELTGAAPGWHSTGLYAVPGRPFWVRASCSGWRLRVGCHADRLWGRERWSRWPEVSFEVPLPAGRTRFASPFGGPVYLVAPPGAPDLEVRIERVVEAPLFVLGNAQSAADWARRRDAPGPWAELCGRSIALSVPSDSVRELEDPTALLEWWDSVVAAHRELAGRPLPERPERVVADVEISAGYMHSGYPIMTHLDVATPAGEGPAPVLDLERLRAEGSWGLFHELGHNHQRADWTFGGTGEVTCNLFTLHAMQVLCGIEPWQHPWLAGARERSEAYLAAPDFARWKQDPALALLTYAELQRQIGWEPFRRTLAEYESLPDSARPHDDAERIDQWVLRLSRAAGHDLRPFFQRWGWPLSEELRADPRLDRLEPL